MANLKKNKKFHFTYRTTNLINNRYYLGMHSTNRLDDGYLGSGKRLYYEISKYGRDNFKFEILEHFDSREQLVQAEINLITEHDLKNPNCLNCKPGGQGGFTIEQTRNGGKLSGAKHAERMKNDPQYKEKIVQNVSKCSKARYNVQEKEFSLVKHKYDWTGKNHSEETKKKIGIANSTKQKGESNSQYGTCWITNEIENKKIKKSDPIPEGWRLGR